MKSNFLVILVLGALFIGCEKQLPIPVNIEEPKPFDTAVSINGVYILNEGNFGWSNASVTYYNTETKIVSENMFQTANGFALGDVAQDIYVDGDKTYIVVNNSGKIEVVNTSDFKSIATISGFNSPRYFVKVNANTAYVSELYQNKIYIINLAANTITGSISLNGWTEKMRLFQNHVFVQNITQNSIYKIDVSNNQVIDTLQLTKGLNSIEFDKNNKLWALCGGDTSVAGSLYRIDPNSMTIEQSFSFTGNSNFPSYLCFNGEGDEMYFVNEDIYKMNISAFSIPTQSIINVGNSIVYGLAVHPNSCDIYIADAIDYVQKGDNFKVF
jgi:DNA-binding beta-propeller fold protein YncE